MSDDEPTMTDAAAPAPFTMVAGDPAAMVCEGDVCFVPAPPVEVARSAVSRPDPPVD